MKKTADTYISIVIFILSLLFLYTSLSKLMNIPYFRTALNDSKLLRQFSPILTYAIPLIEIILTILFFRPATRSLALLLSSILLATFAAYIKYMLLYEPDLPCACGGIIKYISWTNHFILNIVLSIASLIAYILNIRSSQTKLTYEI